MEDSIKVVHIRDSLKEPDRTSIYVGRGEVRPQYRQRMENARLGNPFPLGQLRREESIARFDKWMREKYQADESFRKRIDDLACRVSQGEKIELICFCKPKSCHGDKIKTFIEEILEGC